MNEKHSSTQQTNSVGYGKALVEKFPHKFSPLRVCLCVSFINFFFVYLNKIQLLFKPLDPLLLSYTQQQTGIGWMFSLYLLHS